MINKQTICGFDSVLVVTEDGGRVKVTDYTNENNKVDIGAVHSNNPHGLGFSSYIRNKADVINHINGIKRTTWITDEEKKELIELLKQIESKAE